MVLGNGVPKKHGSGKRVPAPPSLTLVQESRRREVMAGKVRDGKASGVRPRSRTPTGIERGGSQNSLNMVKRSATPQAHRRMPSVTPTGPSRTSQGGKRAAKDSSTPRSASPSTLRASSSSPLFLRRPASTPTSQDSSRSAQPSTSQYQQLKQQLGKVTQERDSLKAALRVQLELNRSAPSTSRHRTASSGRRDKSDPGMDGLLEGIGKNMITNFGITFTDVTIDREALLGCGGFGTVYKGDYQATEVAVKVLRGDKAWTEEELEVWKTEVKIMTLLRHPNILMLLGAVFEKERLAIITEYCESGTLQEAFKTMMDAKEQVVWGRKLKWLMQIAKGMAFLHHKRIFHRDLKSANVFVTGDTMKIADFGLSKIGGHDGKKNPDAPGERSKSSATTFAPPKTLPKLKVAKDKSLIKGTFAFMAPEVWAEQPYTDSCDVYSFGVLMTELMAGDIPFERDWQDDCSWRIMTYASRPKVLERIAGECIPEGVRAIQAMCVAKPHNRPGFATLVTMLRNEAKEAYAETVAPFPDARYDPWIGIPWSEWPKDVHDPLSETTESGGKGPH